MIKKRKGIFVCISHVLGYSRVYTPVYIRYVVTPLL